MTHDADEQSFGSKVIRSGGLGALLGGAYGAVVAAYTEPPPATVSMRSVGSMAVRQMSVNAVTVGTFGAALVAGESMAESVRGKKDGWNAVAGAALAGIPIGIRGRSIKAVLGCMVALGGARYAIGFIDNQFASLEKPPRVRAE